MKSILTSLLTFSNSWQTAKYVAGKTDKENQIQSTVHGCGSLAVRVFEKYSKYREYLPFFFFFFFIIINRTITIFLNKFQYEKKKKCSDEEAQEKPQGLCELSFLKI